MRHARTRWRMAQIAELVSLGFTRRQCAETLKIPAPTVSTLAALAGVPKHYDKTGWAETIAKSQERAKTMAALYRDGYTLEQISKQYGISRERVRQLMTKHLGVRAKDGGQTKTARDRRERIQRQREDRMQMRAGCTVAQWEELHRISREMVAAGRGKYQTPLAAFRSQRNNAKIRGIGWDLTLWQWWTLWEQSGHWSDRGRGFGYVMCRKGDTGPYAVGNVYFATGAQNSSDGQRKRRVDPSLPIGVYRTPTGTFTAFRSQKGLGTYPTIALARAAYLRNERIAGALANQRSRHGLPTGVTHHKHGKPYRAYYYEGKKQIHVGCFNTVDEAVAALALRALPTPMQRAA
jgi:hypothetical protein